MLAIPYGWRFSLLYRAPLRAGRFCGVSFGPRPGARPPLRPRHAPFASPVLYRSRAVRPRGPCPFFIIPQTRPATCPGRAKAPGGNGHRPPSEACLPGDPAVTWGACVSGVGMGAFLIPAPTLYTACAPPGEAVSGRRLETGGKRRRAVPRTCTARNPGCGAFPQGRKRRVCSRRRARSRRGVSATAGRGRPGG